MRIIISLTLAVLLHAGVALGSGPFPGWHRWTIDVNDVSCDLRSEYSNPGYSNFAQAAFTDPNSYSGYPLPDKGALEGTIYWRVLAGFSINTQTHGTHYPAWLVGKNRFYFFLYPEKNTIPDQLMNPDNRHIVSVTVNGEKATSADGTAYWLSPDQTKSVFESHTKDQTINITVSLDDGKTKQINMPAFPQRRFRVWAAIVDTCAREIID